MSSQFSSKGRIMARIPQITCCSKLVAWQKQLMNGEKSPARFLTLSPFEGHDTQTRAIKETNSSPSHGAATLYLLRVVQRGTSPSLPYPAFLVWVFRAKPPIQIPPPPPPPQCRFWSQTQSFRAIPATSSVLHCKTLHHRPFN